MYNQIEKYRCLLTPKRQTFNSLRAISISSLTSNLRWRSLAVFSSACLFFLILNILQVVFVYKQLYNIVFWSWHTHILGWVTTLAVNVKTSCRSSYLPCCDYCKQLPPPHRRVSILNYGMRSRDCFGFFFSSFLLFFLLEIHKALPTGAILISLMSSFCPRWVTFFDIVV